MTFAEKEHAEPRLTYAAAYRERELVFHESFVEREGKPLGLSFQLELSDERFFVHAYAHGRDLESPVQHGVIQHDVAVERPVVVVGSSAVVLFAAFQSAAYLHKEHRAAFSDERGLSFGRGQVGIHILELLGGHESDLVGERSRLFAEVSLKCVHALFECFVYLFDGRFEVLFVSVLAGNDLFPVPLVYIKRVEIVADFVAAYRVHVGIETALRLESVFV